MYFTNFLDNTKKRHKPVKLIDVLDVAEEGADLLGFEWQVTAVNNAAKIVLRERNEEIEHE